MKRVLIVSPIPFAPDFEGNRKRVRQIIDLLMDSGFIVDFLNILHDSGDICLMRAIINGDVFTLKDQKKATWYRIWRIRHRVSKLIKNYKWFNIPGDSWFFDEIFQEVISKHRLKKYDVIVCEYPVYSKLFEHPELNGVLKIIDTHDVFADRYKIFLKNGQRPQWFSTSREEEKKLLKRADLILAIQDHEKEYFLREYGIEAINFPFLEQPVQSEYVKKLKELPSSERKLSIVFVGSNNQINLVAANWIIENLMVPQMLNAGIQFNFVGSICTSIEKKDGLILHGVVDNLDDIFLNMDVLVNFLHGGSGLPIKVISCLSRGTLILANSAGIRGVDDTLKSQGVYIAETKEQARDVILELARLSLSERIATRIKTLELYSEYFQTISKDLILTIDNVYKK